MRVPRSPAAPPWGPPHTAPGSARRERGPGVTSLERSACCRPPPAPACPDPGALLFSWGRSPALPIRNRADPSPASPAAGRTPSLPDSAQHRLQGWSSPSEANRQQLCPEQPLWVHGHTWSHQDRLGHGSLPRACTAAPPPPRLHASTYQGLGGWEGLQVPRLRQLGDQVLWVHVDL